MKAISNRSVMTVLLVLAMALALAACSQTAVAAPADGVAVVKDIATTQYFTDEAVSEADVETIVQAGINAPSAMNGQPWHFSVITDTEVMQKIADGMGGGMPMGGTPPSGFEGKPEGMPEGMPENMPEGMPENMPEGMPEEMPGNRENFPPAGEGFPAGEMPAMPAGGAGGQSKAGITDAPLVIVISCKPGSELDAGLACQNMSVAAQLLGYGSKIISSPTMALNGAEQDAYRELLGIPQEYSAAAILLIGREDTSVDASVDGYTGATTRNPAEELVTYIAGAK